MDKNTLTGFILIAAVLIGFSYFSRPSEAEMEAQRPTGLYRYRGSTKGTDGTRSQGRG